MGFCAPSAYSWLEVGVLHQGSSHIISGYGMEKCFCPCLVALRPYCIFRIASLRRIPMQFRENPLQDATSAPGDQSACWLTPLTSQHSQEAGGQPAGCVSEGPAGQPARALSHCTLGTGPWRLVPYGSFCWQCCLPGQPFWHGISP